MFKSEMSPDPGKGFRNHDLQRRSTVPHSATERGGVSAFPYMAKSLEEVNGF
jgi:hypothetical protein